jgi:hypothetical protein
MPKKRMTPYQCPRCGYETSEKDRVRRHLYGNKKACPATLNLIDLTDEIRAFVLENRQYSLPKKEIGQIQNIVNNFNILNNFVNQMDSSDKLTHLLDHQNKKMLGFDDKLENYFENRIKRLEDTSFKAPYTLTQSDLIELVDKLTRVDKNRLEELNVLFDKKIKRFLIYQDSEWANYFEETGITELVNLIKSYYLDNYELYLIRSIHMDGSRVTNRVALNEHLTIYYRFLAIFDLTISVVGTTDEEILGHRLVENSEYYLEDKYLKLYNDQKKLVKQTEKNRIKRQISNIVKENSVHNIAQLNSVLMDLLQINDDFRNKLSKNTHSNN